MIELLEKIIRILVGLQVIFVTIQPLPNDLGEVAYW